MMWDEDPTEAEGVYQLVRGSVLLALVLALLTGLLLGDWSSLKKFGMIVLVVGPALCGYALIARMMAAVFLFLTREKASDTNGDSPNS